MPKLLHTILAMTFTLGILGPARAGEEGLSRAAVAKRAKLATVLVEVKPKDQPGRPRPFPWQASSGSGFFVHASGVLVTNEHVVRQVNAAVTVVLYAGTKKQKVLGAKVLRRDRDLDLALLRLEGNHKIDVLELGSDKDLGELTELIACGFPFGAALGRNTGSGEYPSISINVGSVTSLRHKDGKLHRIQLDAAVNPGNSGGPVLDRSGKVVGVVVSGIRGTGINAAIPVSHLQHFLAEPEIVLKLPLIKATNQHEAFEFTATATSLFSQKVMELQLILDAGQGKERRFPMKYAEGIHRIKAVPFPAPQGPALCRVEVKYQDGTVAGTAVDQAFRVGSKEIRFSQLRTLLPGHQAKATLGDGQQLEGKLAGLDVLQVKVGKQNLRLDLAAATELAVEPPENGAALSCIVLARQDGRQVGRLSVPLCVEGHERPVIFSGWTLDVKKMRVADTALAGKIHGVDFRPDNIQLLNTGLSLRSGSDNIHIFLNPRPGRSVYEYGADDQPQGRRPAVHCHINSASWTGVYTTGYALRVEFGKDKDGKTPGKLYLCLPDEDKSWIAGTFTLQAEP